MNPTICAQTVLSDNVCVDNWQLTRCMSRQKPESHMEAAHADSRDTLRELKTLTRGGVTAS